MERWDCCVTERGLDGKTHFWNITLDAYDAKDAAEHALVGYDLDRIDGVEVERRVSKTQAA